MCKLIYIITFSILFANSENIKHEKFDWKLNLIPFVGQIKNKKYIKTVALATLQSYSLYNFYDYNKKKQIGKRNTYAWWVFGLYFYGIIDAYVDYSLKNFPKVNKQEGDKK
tara:strand:- start:101 stop:433 length:333 start_codon:yes stop_codon:yes gene_type:complete